MRATFTVLAAGISLALTSNIARAIDIQFDQLELSDISTNEVSVSKGVYVDGAYKKLKFDELFRSGQIDKKNGEMYGLMKDYMGNPAVTDLGSSKPYVCSGNYSGVRGSGTDFTALLDKGDKKYMVTQFECQNGGMYTAELEQKDNGKLKPIPGTLQFVDNTEEWGGWVHCAGSVTPWNSYLGGEEYEPNAKTLETVPTGDSYYNDKVEAYWLGDYEKSSPYHNGWITEVDFDENGKASYAKHYSMGRFSHELGYVMPDEKTVYLTDDGTNDTLFMFVAKKKGDLSKGTLYAAKWNQTSSIGGGSADLDWINLGFANNKEIKNAIAKGIKFSDMFTEGETGCQWIGANGNAECLSIIPGKEKLASRLESRRYAALLGATHEFRKMEGFTFDPLSNKAFIAISEVGRAMLPASEVDPEKGKSYDDLGTGMVVTGDHVQVEAADYCGAIYSMDLKMNKKGKLKKGRDNMGYKINSRYVVTNMNTILYSEGAYGSDMDPNTCADNNLDKMAQPDNIAMIPGSDILLLGEDGKHDNNMIWAYDLGDETLTRIVSVPEGAETTSPYIHHVGGQAYLTVVAQHPDESAKNAYGDSITGVIRLKD